MLTTTCISVVMYLLILYVFSCQINSVSRYIYQPTCICVMRTLDVRTGWAKKWGHKLTATILSNLVFARLANTLLKDQESARDNHVLVCNFARYFKNVFTDRRSNKPFLICLLTTPPHLKYVATLPSNVSLIACFRTLMFYKVVWQHMQGVAGFLITSLLQIYQEICHRKTIITRLRFDGIMATSL